MNRARHAGDKIAAYINRRYRGFRFDWRHICDRKMPYFETRHFSPCSAVISRVFGVKTLSKFP